MSKYKVTIQSIDELFDAYRLIINDENLCIINQSNLSNFAFQIDSFALATILNYYNIHPDLSKNQNLWKSNLFIIRSFAMVSCEIVKFLTEHNHIDVATFEEPNNLEDIFSLRNKIHQFKYRNFTKTMSNIDLQMGRSRNRLTPHLDLRLEYFTDSGNTKLLGTNIYQFHFGEAKVQPTMTLMQRIIRTVEGLPFFSSNDFKIQRGRVNPKHKWQVYCYTDIISSTKIKNERVLDRVLFAFDDLCCVSQFFSFAILTDEYLREAPYLIFFFCKMIAITLDETFDNFNEYILRSNTDSDGEILKNIMDGIDDEFILYCQSLRNNLHYDKQASLSIGDADELYLFLKKELSIVELVLGRIRSVLNINPTRGKLLFYSFLSWAQNTNN